MYGRAGRLPGNRIHHVDLRQSTEVPGIWDGCVMTRDWRLVHGDELYDIKADPGQRHDVSAERPDVVRQLREAQEQWWDQITPRMNEYAPISLGADAENPTRLNSMDVLGDVAWNQNHIAMAQKACGTWAVKVEKLGRYRFALRRWPKELNLPLDAGISQEAADRLAPYESHTTPRTIQPVRARVALFDREQTVDVAPGELEAVFECDVPRIGQTRLDAWFIDAQGRQQAAYYVYVERL